MQSPVGYTQQSAVHHSNKAGDEVWMLKGGLCHFMVFDFSLREEMSDSSGHQPSATSASTAASVDYSASLTFFPVAVFSFLLFTLE